MGRAIDYCTVCGDMVPVVDLEKGKAVEVAEKVYCAKCRAQAPAVTAPSNGRKTRTGSTGSFPSVRPAGTGTGRIPNVGSGSQRLPQAGPTTQRLAHVHVDEPPEQGKSKAPLIAGAAAGIVLIAAIVLFAMQSAADKAAKAADQKRKDDAKAAFDQVVDFRQANPEDADGLLKLIDTNLPKVKNSDWSGKMAAERDDALKLKQVLEIRTKRQGRLDGLRSQVSTAKDLVPVITEIEAFGKEMAAANDTSFSNQAKALLAQARDKRIQNAVEEAKSFEVQNPDKYLEAIEKWASVQMLCETGAESWQKQAQDKMSEIKGKRENAARSDWELVRVKVDGLRKQKRWEDCQKEIRDYTEKWKGTAAIDDATKLAWDIDTESKRAATPDTPVKPDPGKAAPKDWTVLFDDKTAGDWRVGGAKMKWETKGGARVGENTVTTEEAKNDKENNGIGFLYSGKAYAAFEVEMDITLVKGEVMFLVGINGEGGSPAAVSIRSAAGSGAQLIVEAGKPYKVTVQVRAESIAMSGAGLQGGNWRYTRAGDGKDHGAGQFGFAVNPQSELQVRSVRIRAIP